LLRRNLKEYIGTKIGGSATLGLSLVRRPKSGFLYLERRL